MIADNPELAEELEAKIMEALKSGDSSAGTTKKPKLKKAADEKPDNDNSEDELDDISDSEFPDDFSIDEDVTED